MCYLLKIAKCFIKKLPFLWTEDYVLSTEETKYFIKKMPFLWTKDTLD